MTRRIKGILFDLGGTLLDFGRVDARSLFESGGRLAYEYLKGLGQPVPSFAKFHRRQLRAVRWQYVVSRLTRREFNALDLIGRISRRMGQRLSPAQTIDVAWRWYEPLSRQARAEPGLRDLLRELADDGLTLGLISNTFIPGEVLDRHLAAEGLTALLPIRVYSCDVRYRKPHPRIFQLAMKRGGLVPDETLFVGDSLRADIDGSNRAGMISVLMDPTGKWRYSEIRPRHRIGRLAELRQIIAAYADR